MDELTRKYLFEYYGHVARINDTIEVIKDEQLTRENNPHAKEWRDYWRPTWKRDSEAEAWLREGWNVFERNTAQKLKDKLPDRVFFNLCPECEALCRTPHARQCRKCGHQWHDIVSGNFMCQNIYRSHGRGIILTGQVTKGEAQAGLFVDLCLFGQGSFPRIIAVEPRHEQVPFPPQPTTGLVLAALPEAIERRLEAADANFVRGMRVDLLGRLTPAMGI